MLNPDRSGDEHARTQAALDRRREKIYVKVTSDFDTTGYMQPRAITWHNGRSFRIDRVKDFRPAVSLGLKGGGDCYTIVIGGEERHLFFERTDRLFPARVGRWYIEGKPDHD